MNDEPPAIQVPVPEPDPLPPPPAPEVPPPAAEPTPEPQVTKEPAPAPRIAVTKRVQSPKAPSISPRDLTLANHRYDSRPLPPNWVPVPPGFDKRAVEVSRRDEAEVTRTVWDSIRALDNGNQIT